MKRLGIIGGMGPAATARLFTRIVELTDAGRDQDHLDIRIVNNPHVPDRTAFLQGKPGALDFVPVLRHEAAELEAAGCDVIALPCNTSHTRLAEIASALKSAALVDMIGEAATHAEAAGCTAVGILATDGTVSCGVYQHALEARGIGAVTPTADAQAQVMAAIYDYVKAGKRIPEGHLEAVFEELAAHGCDGLMLGCTELTYPTAMWQGIPVIDALDVLARCCIRACGACVKA